MATPTRRTYVTPDVKHHGAIEEVTKDTWTLGSGDYFLQHLLINDPNCSRLEELVGAPDCTGS